MRKDFECERDRWIGIWKKDPESNCVKAKNMKFHSRVQALSSQMMEEYGVCLKNVSSSAIKPWMDLNEKSAAKAEFKLKVFKQIVRAIKEDKNPLTGIPFGDSEYGLTEDIVKAIIRHERTGHIKPPRREYIKLWKGDVHLADALICKIIQNGSTQAEKDLASQLYYRIHKGPFEAKERATA